MLAALDRELNQFSYRMRVNSQADTQLQGAIKGKRFPRLKINKYINQTLSVIAS